MPDCGYCGKPIDHDARICPHCGVSQRKRSIIVEILRCVVWGVLILVGVCIAIALGALLICAAGSLIHR